MAQQIPSTTAALDSADRQALARALEEDDDVTVFVNGTSLKLPSSARDAVVALLKRLADGEGVMVSSVADMLTTSQAAEAAGISHTYLRNLTDAGVIAVQYRGTHRRIRLADVLEWLEQQRAPAADGMESGK